MGSFGIFRFHGYLPTGAKIADATSSIFQIARGSAGLGEQRE
jgi:hypothetical protein